MNLEGKAAIVTGAGTGVGQQTAFQLANHGCNVLVNYTRSREGAEAPLQRVATPESVAAGILSILTGPGPMTGHVIPHEGGVAISL